MAAETCFHGVLMNTRCDECLKLPQYGYGVRYRTAGAADRAVLEAQEAKKQAAAPKVTDAA